MVATRTSRRFWPAGPAIGEDISDSTRPHRRERGAPARGPRRDRVRVDQRHRPRHCRGTGGPRRNDRPQRPRRPREHRGDPHRHRRPPPRRGGLPRRRHDGRRLRRRPRLLHGEPFRPGGHPRQQCRDPARRPGGGLSAGEVGRDPRGQPVVGVPHDPRRRAPHEAGGLGADRQRRVRARARRFALQVGVRGGEARPPRPDEDGGARTRRDGDHRQRRLPRLRVDTARGGAGRGPGESARRPQRRGGEDDHPRQAAEQALRDGRGARRDGGVPVLAGRRLHHGRGDHGRRRAAARTAPSPGASSTACSTSRGSASRRFRPPPRAR